jgi:hypothetical protein
MKRHKTTFLPVLLVLFLTAAAASASVPPNVIEEPSKSSRTRGAAPQGTDHSSPRRTNALWAYC